jgi:hypothetical protein
VSSDAIVTTADVLRAVMELRRRGHDEVLRELEAREPDLAEHLMEELGSIHRLLLETGATPKRVRRLSRRVEALALVMVAGLRHAHRRLWDEDAAGTPLAQIDPTPEEDPPDGHPMNFHDNKEGDDDHDEQQ